LGDDRRAGEAVARSQGGAVVDRRGAPLALEEDLAAVGDGRRGVAVAAFGPWQLRRRAGAGPDGAQVDDLRRRVRHAEAVELLVQRVEAPVEHGYVALERHRNLVA